MPPASKRPVHHVAVITGTRAEFGLLEPVLQAMRGRPRLRPHLIVTGMHLLDRFGKTIDDIRAAGWKIDATVPMQSGHDSAAGEALAVARGIEGISKALERLRCDIVVVLGDRIEAFAGACAAAVGRRVLAHIHGGDRAVGDVDDSLRNAITRLAHIHFAASDDARRRLLRMGEEPWRIRLVGAPGMDAIRLFRAELHEHPARQQRRIRELLGDIAGRRYAVVIQHPSGRSQAAEATAAQAVIDAVERCGLNGVAIYPNSDPGHAGIIRVLKKLATRPGWLVFHSLPREDYLRVVAGAAVLVGNSSSGIIESAGLGVSAVNVGNRQEGRLRCGPNVIDVAETSSAVARGIRHALGYPPPSAARSVYGNGLAGPQIAAFLERLIISPRILRKHLAY